MSDAERRPRTFEEHFQRFLSEIGQEGSRYGEAHFLPFQIESLTLKNIGPFEKFEAKFRRDSLNIIHGAAGSGKSYIMESILLAFGRRPRYFQSPYFNRMRAMEKGTIKLRIFPDQNSVNLTGIEREENIKGYQCLIADELFLAPPMMRNIISDPSLLVDLHRRLNIQAIVTAPSHFDTKMLPTSTQIISLKNYPHYR